MDRSRRGMARLSESERNWARSLAIVAVVLAVFAAVYGEEIRTGRWSERWRLVYEPAETATRYIGLSHFLVALFFVATSRAMRRWKPRLSFLATAPIAVILCIAYGALQAWSPMLGGALFYSVFLLHVFRDEAFFYFANRDGGEANPPLTAVFFWWPVCVVASAAAVLESILLVGAVRFARLDALVASAPRAAVIAVGLLPLAIAAGAGARIRFCRRASGADSLGQIVRSHAPVFRVLTGDIAVFFLDLAFTGQGYAIVILHFAEWYVFTVRGLRGRPSSTAGWVGWIRTTTAGFRLLHVGLVLAAVAVGLVWTHGLGSNPRFSVIGWFLRRQNFPYWTIAHVASSIRGR